MHSANYHNVESTTGLAKRISTVFIQSKSLLILDVELTQELKKEKLSSTLKEKELSKLENLLSLFIKEEIEKFISGKPYKVEEKLFSKERLKKLVTKHFEFNKILVLYDSTVSSRVYRQFLSEAFNSKKELNVNKRILQFSGKKSFMALRKQLGDDFTPYSYNCAETVTSGLMFRALTKKGMDKYVSDKHKLLDFKYVVQHWYWKMSRSIDGVSNFYIKQLDKEFKGFVEKTAALYDPQKNTILNPPNKSYLSERELTLYIRFKYDFENNDIYNDAELTLQEKATKFKIIKISENNECIKVLREYGDSFYNDLPDIDKLKPDVQYRVNRFILRDIFYDIYLCMNFKDDENRLKYDKVMDVVREKLHIKLKDSEFIKNPYVISPELLASLDNGLMRSIYVYTTLQLKTQERDLFKLERKVSRRNTNKRNKILECTQPKSIGYSQFQLVLYEARKYLSENEVETIDSKEEGVYGLDNYLKIIESKNNNINSYGLDTLIKEKGDKLHALKKVGES